jgi:hypothetical protein
VLTASPDQFFRQCETRPDKWFRQCETRPDKWRYSLQCEARPDKWGFYDMWFRQDYFVCVFLPHLFFDQVMTFGSLQWGRRDQKKTAAAPLDASNASNASEVHY